MAVLDDAHLTGTGQSSAALLGVSVAAISELLVGQLLREVVARGARAGPLTPLAAQLNHDLTHLQSQRHDARLAQLAEDLRSALATLDRLDRLAGSIPARTTPPLGRPVHELTDPFALEVHRAIDAPARATTLPALPVYVQRYHDRQLQVIIQRAAEGASAAAVLVGGSSTGKTRACWEAVQALPDDWRLWHPIDPSRPEAASDALPAVGPRTVVWLNEAQHYLLTPTSDLGERVAAGLRELLRDPARRPVLLLGTIWPEYWATLTTPPAPEQQGDPHAQARALLTGTDVPVPDAFTGPALQTLKAAAREDPRLAEAAARAEDGRITQFLAGAPALLERYRNAPPAAKALVEAAMDARRLGHGPYLPHRLLEAAAPGFLTDQQWDELGEDWLEQALAYCAAPCRGARGPLTRVRPRPGQPTPAQPHYRLADYLEQTGRVMRETVLAPVALWDAFVAFAEERSLLQIAEEAERRSLYRHAFRLYQRAAGAGDLDAMRLAAGLLEEAGRLDEVIDWLQARAAEVGSSVAIRRIAGLLEGAGQAAEAIALYQRAAEAGDSYALERAAELLKEAGRLNEAIDWLQTRAAEANDRDTQLQVARLLERAGRAAEAIVWYQRVAEAGDGDALRRAVWLLKEAGRLDEAIDWLQTRAAEAGDSYALRRAAALLERIGRLEEAVGVYQRAAEAGDRDALWQAARLLERVGRIHDAARLSKYGIEPGGQIADEWH
jgi:tetratricopeptide (TPR) repeat protein